MVDKLSISVITCSMNRHEYIKENLISTKRINHLKEHVIVDWSSQKKILDDKSKYNKKLKIVRVENEKDWWLSRAYNFAAYFAESDFILKLDVDTLAISENINNLDLEKIDYLNFTIDGNGFGNFLIKKNLFEELNGFNEYIYGWGYDDADFHNRAQKYQNFMIDGSKYISVGAHKDSKRINYINKKRKDFEGPAMLGFHKRNRFISQIISWDRNYKREYEFVENNTYKVNHVYKIQNLNKPLQKKAKIIFFRVFFNEYFNTNLEKLNFLLGILPVKLFEYIFKIKIIPSKI